MLTPEDHKPFEDIAHRKGVEIHFGDYDTKLDESNIHLDMEMIEQSIRCAIANTKNSEIKAKFEHLLSSGTDSQKVHFVVGSGTYYFPDDIENLAKLSRQSGGRPLGVDCHRVCETIWYTICRCTGNAQWCRDEARAVCHLVCD
ncbi:MAG: hypothetical protein LV479_04895 [Methylacidiphilales bacterium]|nr:hypothetical protein [Candidatus Methylacidiphilales bacterium]